MKCLVAVGQEAISSRRAGLNDHDGIIGVRDVPFRTDWYEARLELTVPVVLRMNEDCELRAWQVRTVGVATHRGPIRDHCARSDVQHGRRLISVHTQLNQHIRDCWIGANRGFILPGTSIDS